MYLSPDEKSKMVADGIGVAHFIVANLCVLLGEFTELFNPLIDVASPHKGLYFVYHYFDRPAYYLFRGLTEATQEDLIFTFLTGELIIVVSTVLYGFIAFFSVRLYLSLND